MVAPLLVSSDRRGRHHRPGQVGCDKVDDQDLAQRVAEITGYRFRDTGLLASAFTHASFVDRRVESNERLEFLGDAVLAMVVCEELFRRFPDYLEGQLTKVKSAVVSRRTCASIARRLGLVDLLRVGKGMQTQKPLPSSLAAAVFESLIAAIYLDSGSLEVVRQFVLSQLEPYIDRAAATEYQRNYKSQLQHYAQKHLGTTPVYQLLDEQGPDHSKCFEVCVVIDGRRFPSAWGASKKDAEQKAAQLALQELGALEPEPPERTVSSTER